MVAREKRQREETRERLQDGEEEKESAVKSHNWIIGDGSGGGERSPEEDDSGVHKRG